MIKFIIIIIILIIVLIILKNYFTLKELDLKIDACSGSLFEILDLKKETIEKIIKSSKNKDIKNIISDINTDNLFKYDEDLYQTFKKIEVDKTLTKKALSMTKDIKKIDEEIDGLKNFYNVNVNKYNLMYNKKPFIYLYNLLKLEKKEVFKERKTSDLNILKD